MAREAYERLEVTVERLRAENAALNRDGAMWYGKWVDKCAEVERLREENARLKSVLGPQWELLISTAVDPRSHAITGDDDGLSKM